MSVGAVRGFISVMELGTTVVTRRKDSTHREVISVQSTGSLHRKLLRSAGTATEEGKSN